MLMFVSIDSHSKKMFHSAYIVAYFFNICVRMYR